MSEEVATASLGCEEKRFISFTSLFLPLSFVLYQHLGGKLEVEKER